MKHKILISEKVSEEAIEYLTENGVEVKFGRGLDEKTVIEDLKDCDAVLVRVMKITKKIIDSCPNLKIIAKHGVGCDSIDVAAAKEKGITVTNTPGANSRSVAEHTMALILACAHQIRPTNIEYAKGNYNVKNAVTITEISEKTLGLVGFGHIASMVAEMAHSGFRMNVIAYDPYIGAERIPGYVDLYDDVDRMIRSSDYLSLHIPFTPDNRRFIDKKRLSLMKPTAYLINTARGELIDTTELINAIKEKRIRGAGLDVCESEPDVPSELFDEKENVILTPHCGAASGESMARMGMSAAKSVVEYLTGKR